MGRGKQLSEEVVNAVIERHREGKSYNKIGIEFGINKATAYQVVQRYVLSEKNKGKPFTKVVQPDNVNKLSELESMGVPDDTSNDNNNNSKKPVAKRQRLSLKNYKTKNVTQDTSPQTNDSTSSVSHTSTITSNASSSYDSVTTSTTSTTTDVDSIVSMEDTRVPAVASLENLGNTCFMNSVIQVLRYTPGFLHNLSLLYQDIQTSEKVMKKQKKGDKDQSEDNNCKGSWRVVKNVYKVYRDLTSLESRYDEVASDDVMSMAVKPNKILYAVRDLNPMFCGNMQHDAQEFLRCLLCYFQDAEKDVQKYCSYLPQKLSPKINPVMHRFLHAAKTNPESKLKIEKIVNEISNNPDQLNNVKDAIINDETEKVKMKLFPDPTSGADVSIKQDGRCEDIKTEISSDKSEPMITAPDNVPANDVKVETPMVTDQDKETSEIKADSVTPIIIASDNEAKDVKFSLPDVNLSTVTDGGGKMKTNLSDNRFKPYGKKLLGPKCARNRANKDNVKSEGSSQPSISDIFMKTYSKNKRLGLSRSRTVVKCSEEKLDNVVHGKVKENDVLDENSHEKQNNDDQLNSVKKESCVGRSFQDVFLSFMDSSAGSGSSDSDDGEDIVMKKMREKLAKESPRRSPRKTKSELCRPSPVSKPALSSLSVGNVKSAQYKLNFDEKENDSPEVDSHQDPSSAICEGTCDTTGTSQPAPVVLDPVVVLENCDHVLTADGKSVSASLASQCMSPVKHGRSASTSSIGNYLKERSLNNSIDMSDEEDIKKAILDMMNSPVKSRSKYDLIERTFQGTMMLRTRCTQCETSWERQEEFHDVSVPVRIENTDSDDEQEDDKNSRPCSLLDLIQASTDVEKLVDGNKYQCDVCKALVNAERSVHYDVLPDILSVHLKRMCAETDDPTYITKINDHVNIPLTLPCIRYRCPEVCLRPDHRYMLYAIVTHAGSSLTSGHYLSYVRSPREQSDNTASGIPGNISCPTYFNDHLTETEENDKPGDNTNQTAVPSTRRKLGVQPKLPSRFNDSVLSDCKVKSLSNIKKPMLMESLMPAKTFNGEWFECNDESVRVYEEEEFLELLSDKSGSLLGTPYLLFYHKSTMC